MNVPNPIKVPRGFLNGWVLGAVLWLLLLLGVRRCAAQVPSALTFNAQREAVGVVRNTATSPMRVTIELHYARDSAGRVLLGPEVSARISPRNIPRLAPFQQQTFRIRLAVPVLHGTTLRLVTTFWPLEPTPASTILARGVEPRLLIATRLITRAVVP